MFDNIEQMLEASRALYEKGVNHKDMTPTKVTFSNEKNMTLASAILADYDVELILVEESTKTEETKKVFEKPTGFRDLFGIL